MATKETKEAAAPPVATLEPEQPKPQTAAEIAATADALGLATQSKGNGPNLQQKVSVRMGVAPTNIEEGWRLAQFIAQSELVPKGYRGRPADVLVAIQFGMEVGLPPMAALHSVFVTNGRPSLWGDGFLAVIMASVKYADHDEYYMVEGERREFLLGPDLTKDDTTAVCTFWRNDSQRARTATFSIAKAKKAGLWTKDGPWQQYPDRMLKFRARGFAGHDAFPDVLRGIRTAEETIDVTPGAALDAPVEAPREVRRLSHTNATAAAGAGPQPVTPDPPPVIALGPIGVVNVENFLGGFTVTLADGTAVDVTEGADALELEKFKGTKHLLRLSCIKVADTLQLQTFSIAD